MIDMPIVPPAAMRVPLGMDCSHAGAVIELMACAKPTLLLLRLSMI